MFHVVVLGHAVFKEFDGIPDLLSRGHAAPDPLLKSIDVGIECCDLAVCSRGDFGGVLVWLDAMVHQFQICHPLGGDNSQRVG